jgi:formylglycine-generating enzyme required for sulfatase activity
MSNRQPANDPEVPPAGATRTNPKDGAEMVYVPAGEFPMGDDDFPANPPRTVTLDGYWIYKNDVTVAQYRKFCKVTGRRMPDPPDWGWKEDHPVVNVDWNDAKDYCGWAGAELPREAYCDWAGAALPTEAQWEKAARGTDGSTYPWGKEFDREKLRRSKTKGGDAGSTAPVGSYPEGASPYGCLDMAGNVWQWCADWRDDNYSKGEPATNPTGPEFGAGHVLRGSSWYNYGQQSPRCAYPGSLCSGSPSETKYRHTHGFRCVVPGCR